MYYWLTVFSPRAVNFSLGSLSTNWKYPHSQSASWNDFRGPSVRALPHPSRVSLSRARSLFRPLLPSAWYPKRQHLYSCFAGYVETESGVFGNRNPAKDWDPESRFHWQRLQSSTWNPEFPAWNPEATTVLDSFTRGEKSLFQLLVSLAFDHEL